MKSALALLALAVAAPAIAAEPFTGPHVEAIAGYDNTDVGPRLPAADGFLYGIGGGYDFALSGLRIGAEAEVDGSTASQSVAGIERRVGRSFYAGARLGVVVTPRVLAYVKGGYANGRFGSDGGGSYTGDGIRIGTGGELALTDRLFAKAEYRYSDYGRFARGQTWVGALGYRF